ncbi:Phenylacetyl- ligase [Lasiodiplodia theobromae]|uniref:Phenylacetyl- ligase n=1 Tax=Lasiodiplodia theobromae TaxID=45133 RepID=UPI0015C3C959|nr:Phenylacetyl- ligase [Lasiodiplodia theobromae]KAF4541527.1 Phenylacetyl- ligase [Lasiodiplodia theobromae]
MPPTAADPDIADTSSSPHVSQTPPPPSAHLERERGDEPTSPHDNITATSNIAMGTPVSRVEASPDTRVAGAEAAAQVRSDSVAVSRKGKERVGEGSMESRVEESKESTPTMEEEMAARSKMRLGSGLEGGGQTAGGGAEKKQGKATAVMGMRAAGGARGERVNVRRKNEWTIESRSGLGWKTGRPTAGPGDGSGPSGKRYLDSTAQSSPGPVEKRQKVDLAEASAQQQVKLPPWKSLVPRVERLLLEAQAHDKDLETYRARIRELENMAREQQTLLDAYRAEETDLSDSDVNYGKVASHLERKKVQLEQKGEQLYKMSKEKVELKKKITELKNENAALLKKNEQWEDSDDILRERLEKQANEYKKLSAEKKEVSKELTAKRNEAESLKKKLQTAEKKLDKDEEKIADLTENRDEWKERYSKAFRAGKTEIEKHRKETNELTKEIQKLNKDQDAMENTIEKLKENLEKTGERLNKAKDKRSPCELCTNKMWAAALHLTLQACEDQENGQDVSLEVIHRMLKQLVEKLPEIEKIRDAGRAFIPKVPHYFEQKSSESAGSSASGQKALAGGLCAMCTNDEILRALYWVVEACEVPQETDYWHTKLVSQMYAWQDAYPDLIQRCLDGWNAERPIDVPSDDSDDDEEAEQQDAGDSEEHDVPREKTMEEKIQEKHGEFYILLVRVQQTIQAFHEAGMPLAELGGAFKDLKAELDKRKENGRSSCDMQDRLDMGQKYLEEQVRFWAERADREGVENGEAADCTPLSVEIPKKIVELREELEKSEKMKKDLAGILIRASNAQVHGSSQAQVEREMSAFAGSLKERYGTPEVRPGVPLQRPEWTPSAAKAQSSLRSMELQGDMPVELSTSVTERQDPVSEPSRERSLGSCSMEGLNSPEYSPEPIARDMPAEGRMDEVDPS